jgi:ABC-2 type transport system permease protein
MNGAWRRIRQILKKEFRQTLREPRLRALVVGPPLIQLLIFGYAVNLDVDNSRIAWMDQDRSPASRRLQAAFEGSPSFRIVATPRDDREVQDLMDRGRVQGVVRVLAGFQRDLDRGATAPVQILIDGTNSNTASIIAAQASALVAAFGAEAMPEQMRSRLYSSTSAAGGPVRLALESVSLRSRVWFNAELKSRDYFVPGVVVNIITLVTLMLTGMAVVREKEIGTMEQLMVTPIRPLELIAGKTLPFAILGLLNVGLVTGAALVIFRVPFRGSALFLVAAAVLFLLSTLGVGLFISTISHTQQQAMMSSFFFFNPAFMLSGFAFPIANMPEPVQWATYLNPVRYFMEIVRGVFLKGTGFETLWPQTLALAVYGAAIFTFSVLRFHKRLD